MNCMAHLKKTIITAEKKMFDIVFWVFESILAFIGLFSIYMIIDSMKDVFYIDFQKSCKAMHKYAIMFFI